MCLKIANLAASSLLKKALWGYLFPALGIGGERRKELCAVERSTEANAEPRKARPPAVPKGKGGNAQIKKIINTLFSAIYNIKILPNESSINRMCA